MAKKVAGELKLQIPAGKANPSPPVGPALGQRGLNIMEFCKAFNAKTQELEPGAPCPTIITYYVDKSFSMEIKTPPASFFLKKAAKIKAGAQMTGKEIIEKYKEEELFPSKSWPVQPGPQELSRPVIDLRQPLNKSWVIQLPLYKNQSDALKDLADISTETDFSYISQKLASPSSDKLSFRIRIGFFETKRDAQRKIYVLKKKLPQFKSFRTRHL